jgi:hypothetical protein
MARSVISTRSHAFLDNRGLRGSFQSDSRRKCCTGKAAIRTANTALPIEVLAMTLISYFGV